MNAVNAVLFILVWTSTAVCQADTDISVSCPNVTGSVGKEVNLTCSVSLQKAKCCITKYKFQYFKSITLPKGSCEQRNNFTYSYTPTKAMTENFTFYVQTTCVWKITEFTVDITGFLKSTNTETPESKDTESKHTAIAAAVGCFSIVLIIIIVTIICKMKSNFIKPCGFQKRMFLCIKQNEDNTTPPEDVI